jgi:hypothetical protein
MANLTAIEARWGTWLLGAILVAQGAGKLLDVRGYFAALGRFQMIPARAVAAVGIAWMASELFAGVGLLVAGLAASPPRSLGLAAAGAAFAGAIGYAVLTVGARVRGVWVANCTCFGIFLPQPLSASVLLQDTLMIAWTGWQVGRMAITK